MSDVASRYRWHEPGGLGTTLRFLLPATGLATLILAIVFALRFSDGSFVIHEPRPGEQIVFPWGDSRWVGLTWIPSLLSWVTIVLWLIWHHQVTANLWSRGVPGLRTRPGWAVGWWFIPFAWYVMPFLALQEVDRRSTPDGSERRMGAILGWWWAAWIAAQLVPLIGLFVFSLPGFLRYAETIPSGATSVDLAPLFRPFIPWMIVAGALQAVAGFFASEVVARIDRSQGAMSAAGALLPPPPPRPDLGP